MKFLQKLFKQTTNKKRGGYLALYGLWAWYEAQTREVQEYLYKSSGYGINTDPEMLFNGNYSFFQMPKELSDAIGTGKFPELYDKYWPKTHDSIISIPYDQHIPTATSFLCGHAKSAFSDRQHEIAKVTLTEAKKRITDKWDWEVYTLLTEDNFIHSSASEKEIAAAIPLVIRFLRENPGFIQSGLPTQLNGAKKDAIGMAAYRLRQEGKIRREKKGRSFQLWVVE